MTALRRITHRSPNDPLVAMTPATAEWIALIDRLEWQYGPIRAAAILSGLDEETETDLAAWRRVTRKPK